MLLIPLMNTMTNYMSLFGNPSSYQDLYPIMSFVSNLGYVGVAISACYQHPW